MNPRRHSRSVLASLTAIGAFALACSDAEAPKEQAAAGGTSTPGAGSPGAGKGGRAGSGGTGGGAGSATAGSSTGGTSGSSAGTGGTTSAGAGGTGAGGSSGSGSGGAAAGASGSTSTGGLGAGGAGGAGAAGSGSGGAAAGAAGGPAGGTAGMAGGSSTASFTCNQVIGIDSTSEWFTHGFEDQVDDARWQIIYYHPGYVEDWAKSDDTVYTLAPTSACAMNSDNPDRVIFNMFADTADSAITNKTAYAAALSQAITNLKNKYSRLKRIDLLTMTRAPGNTPCDSSNRMSIVEQYVDEAVDMVEAAGPPGIVDVQDFFAPNCNVFMDGGPHFTEAGMPIVAKIYGDYYSAEP